jgi:hypothetical protein
MTPCSRWSHTRHGLEIDTPRPGALRTLVLWLLIIGAVLYCLAALTAGDWLAPSRAVGFFVGSWMLGILMILIAVLLLFDHRSNERSVFGSSELITESRVGDWVLHRDRVPLAEVAEVQAVDTAGEWQVSWRRRSGGRLPYQLALGMNEADARALAAAVLAWQSAPQATAPLQEGGQRELPRLLLRMFVARLRNALPLAAVGAGLLLIACVWTLRDEQVRVAPVHDALAAGELLQYRWVVRAPNAEERALNWTQGVARLELGVRWRTDDGIARTQWWRSSEDIMLGMLAETRIAGLIGAPWIELALPTELRPLITGKDGDIAFAYFPAQAPAGDESTHALLRGFDDPIELQAALSLARPVDWQIAYARSNPAQATLASLARIEEASVRGLPTWLLLLAAAIGCAPLWAGLAPLLDGVWLRRGLMLAVLVTVPWWAPYADRIAGYVGVDAAIGAGMRSVAVAAGSEQANAAGYYLEAIPTPPAATDAVIVRWTPQTSAAAEVLPLLDLLRPEPAATNFEAARAALTARAAARIATLEDAGLVALIQRWEPEEFGRYAPLRVAYVDGLCAAHTDSGRSDNTRRWIESALSNPVICTQ